MTVLEMSLSASLLILAVFSVRALALHRLPKMTFVVLWGIALCRLLIPVSVTSQFSVYAALDHLPGLSPGSSASPIDRIVDQSAVAPVHTVLLVWAAGAVACALYFLIPHLRYRRQYRTALPIDSAFIAGWLWDHRTLRPVRVRQLDRITAPLTYGILRPVILLPKAMDLMDETQLAYVLAHEFTHIRRFDTLCKWLLALCACVHWFNPLMWVMYVLANRDMEYACDEAVVRSFGTSRRSAYAHMLLSLEEKRSRHTPLFSHFSKNANKERIHAIMKLKEPLNKSRYTSCRLIFRLVALKMLGIPHGYACAFRLTGQKILSTIRASDLFSGSLKNHCYRDSGGVAARYRRRRLLRHHRPRTRPGGSRKQRSSGQFAYAKSRYH